MHDSMMDIMASMSEIQALQEQIINIQRDALEKAFSLLCLHISTNEVETIEAYRQISDLTSTVKELAVNMKNMLTEQETEPEENPEA